jgi:hypothetical protein
MTRHIHTDSCITIITLSSLAGEGTTERSSLGIVFTEDKLRQQLLVSEVQDHIELIKISDHAEGEVKAGDKLIGRSSMTVLAFLCVCACVYIYVCVY